MEKAHDHNMEIEMLFIDSLSATLFDLALEYVVRKINKGYLRTRKGQIIAYADDIVIITKNREAIKKMLEEQVVEEEKMELKINREKTELTLVQ